MQDNIFINNAITDAMELYIKSKDKKNSLDYNKFLCSVVRMLVLIYGEESLIKAYNEKDVDSFDKILLKYNYPLEELDSFKVNFFKFHRSELRQQQKAIKKKNKYFNLVQKHLIDMMIKKNIVEKVDNLVMNEFYNLLFTANSRDFYRKSTAVLLAYNPYEIDVYAKKQNIVGG